MKHSLASTAKLISLVKRPQVKVNAVSGFIEQVIKVVKNTIIIN